MAWSVILTWGGLRGALSIVLALSLPKDFAYREVLISMTFGVAILSILIHGLTMSSILRWLGIAHEFQGGTNYDLTRGELLTTHAALTEIDQLPRAHLIHPEMLSNLRDEYERKISRDIATLIELHSKKQQLKAEELKWARRHLQSVEKSAVIDAFRRGLLTQAVQEKLLADIDARLLNLESSGTQADAGQKSSTERFDKNSEEQSFRPRQALFHCDGHVMQKASSVQIPVYSSMKYFYKYLTQLTPLQGLQHPIGILLI